MNPTNRHWIIALFIGLFVLEMAWGIYAAHYRLYMPGDAVSRVANAFYVLYSRDPHLGAIGFVWTPLPSILHLIPLLFWPIFPAVAGSGIAAVLISALFAAASACMLYHYTRSQTGSHRLGLTVALLFAFNPFIFMFGANGMTEVIFSFFIIWMVVAFTSWMQKESLYMLVGIGFAMALGFWTRYEMVAFGAAMAACFVLIFWLRKNGTPLNRLKQRSETYMKTEATLIIVLAPAIFSGFVWMLLNYSIMGDPLFFFRSGYSNLAFTQDTVENTDFVQQTSSLIGVLALVLRKSVIFSIPLLCILLVRFLSGRLMRLDTLLLLLLIVSIPAMQAAMLVSGSSYGWLRFFAYTYIIAAAWIPYELGQLRTSRMYKSGAALLCIGLLLSFLIVRDMNDPHLSPEEYGAFHMAESGVVANARLAKEVAAYLDELIEADPTGDPVILTDSFTAFHIIISTRYPRNLLITSDYDFDGALRNPQGYEVDYFLISRLEGSVLQIMHQFYPDLFEYGAPWAELVQDFHGEWRLYRIK